MPKESTHPHKRLLQLDDELKKQIDEFRYSERFPTEAAAIRELIARGLRASAPAQQDGIKIMKPIRFKKR